MAVELDIKSFPVAFLEDFYKKEKQAIIKWTSLPQNNKRKNRMRKKGEKGRKGSEKKETNWKYKPLGI